MMLFAQVGCRQTEEMVDKKQTWGLVLVCIGLYMVWYFRITLKNVKNLDIINEKLFDLKLITADDFSVKIRLTESMFAKFKKDWKIE